MANHSLRAFAWYGLLLFLLYALFYFKFLIFYYCALFIFTGLTFGLLHSICQVFIKDNAPRGTGATMHTILYKGFHSGLGLSVGSFFGGFIYQRLGSSRLFQSFAFLLLISTSITLWTYISITREESSFKKSGAGKVYGGDGDRLIENERKSKNM